MLGLMKNGLILIFLIFVSSPWAQAERRGNRNKWFAGITSWREQSLMKHQTGREIRINTLNVSGRFGHSFHFYKNLFPVNLGILLGHSENMNADVDFNYFQRAVFMWGLDMSIGVPVYLNEGGELGFALGGIFRHINHSVPTAEYKFSTNDRFVPTLSMYMNWELYRDFFWQQTLGTGAKQGETFWLMGLALEI